MAAMRFTRPIVEVPAEASGWRSGAATNTLDDVMRGPSVNPPEVVVLDAVPDDIRPPQEFLDPKEDLWLSTADGRFNAPIVPVRVGEGPNMQTFYVHKNILLKADFFRKALCGQFKERESQSIDLPEEDPAIFHFIIAFLYEDRYVPIKPIATALIPDSENGKAQDMGLHDPADSDTESTGSVFSDSSARSRRHRERRRRREDRRQERLRQKHPGLHRPHCNCPQCLSAGGPPCWQCSAPRLPPPPPPPHFPAVDHYRHRRRSRRRPRQQPPPPPPPPPVFRAGSPPTTNGPPPPPPPPPTDPNALGDRITGEDLRTWLLAYELDLDVYICANKFLLADFKREVARHAVDMLETAGGDAAQPEVLALCTKLYAGLSEADPLLKMIFARLGFLQPMLWARDPSGTAAFLVANPEVAAVILRETAARRHDDFGGRSLPSLERSWPPPPMPMHLPMDVGYYPRPRPVRF